MHRHTNHIFFPSYWKKNMKLPFSSGYSFSLLLASLSVRSSPVYSHMYFPFKKGRSATMPLPFSFVVTIFAKNKWGILNACDCVWRVYIVQPQLAFKLRPSFPSELWLKISVSCDKTCMLKCLLLIVHLPCYQTNVFSSYCINYNNTICIILVYYTYLREYSIEPESSVSGPWMKNLLEILAFHAKAGNSARICIFIDVVAV